MFRDKKAPETHLSDSDILIFNEKGEVTTVIEIKDRDILPKNIAGIIAATNLCNRHFDDDGKEHLFHQPFLHIVLNSNRIKKGSCKMRQMKLINDNLKLGSGNLSGFKICLDDGFEKSFFNTQ